MARRKTHTHEHDTAESGEPAPSPEPIAVGEHEEVNGSHADTRANGSGPPQTRPDGAAAAPAPVSPTVQRAEEVVDHLAERVGHYAGVVGQKVMWLFSRAREEAEDIWAEAKALRRGEHPEETTPPRPR
jgi:hypothetical protein